MAQGKKGTKKVTIATTLRLTPTARCILDKLAEKTGLNPTGYLEITLRDLGRKSGIDCTEGDNGS